jgi:S-adenosylmethionine synthetase
MQSISSSPAVASMHAAEYVLWGHPDKLCDLIADAILDAHIAQDPFARVGCEVLVAKNLLVVAGEISSRADCDYECIVRATLRKYGYTSREIGLDADTCEIRMSLSEQSPYLNAAIGGQDTEMRSGDQAIVMGYAEANTHGYIPFESYVAKQCALALSRAIASAPSAGIFPDGKTMAVCGRDASGTMRLLTLVASAQHSTRIDAETLKAWVRESAAASAVGPLIDNGTAFIINPPRGEFFFGGPQADTGLTGRKLVADSYGPSVPHGGGALSGKDPTKIDRLGAYAARWLALWVVRSGLASKALIKLVYLIGHAEPIAVSVFSEKSAAAPDRQLGQLVSTRFDLRPGALIERLEMRAPHYEEATRMAHYGIASSLPWERARS